MKIITTKELLKRNRLIEEGDQSWIFSSFDESLPSQDIDVNFKSNILNNLWVQGISKSSDKKYLSDIQNAPLIHGALPGLTRLQARDPRLWVTLAFHEKIMPYIQERWVRDNDKTLEKSKGDLLNSPDKIITYWNNQLYPKTVRNCWRDQAVSRLWWAYEIACVMDKNNPKDALAFLYRESDTINAILSKPSLSTNDKILSCIYRNMSSKFNYDIVSNADGTLEKSNTYRGHDRKEFREFMKGLDLAAGPIIIAALDENVLDTIVEKNFNNHMKTHLTPYP